MGAHDFETTAKGTSLQDAYRNAVEAALHEYGHDSYNGTISTTESVRDACLSRHELNAWKRPFDKRSKVQHKRVNDSYERMVDQAEKWGHCYGFAITSYKKNNTYVFVGVAAS